MDTKEITAAAIKKQGSLYKVAKLVGVSYNAAHAWKTGRSEAKGSNLIKLLEVAGKKIHGIALGVVTLSLLSLSPQFAHANPITPNHLKVSREIHYANLSIGVFTGLHPLPALEPQRPFLPIR